MNLLSVEDLTKTLGEQVLFRNIYFGLQRGEKTALVARNGTGKSILINCLRGQDIADSGTIAFQKDIRVGFLLQEPEIPDGILVEEFLFSSSDPVSKALKNYEHAMQSGDMDALDKAAHEVDRLDAWNHEHRIRETLGRLGIQRLDQRTETLSGGQRKRLALCKLLVDQPDLLVLDEPTNHLDVDMIEWLEHYLSESTLTLLVVTHDRYFLDRVCEQIIELENGAMYRFQGNYAYYLEKKAEQAFIDEKEQEKTRNLYRRELEWMRRQPKARTTKSKSRIEAFGEIESNLDKNVQETGISLDVKMNRIGGKILELKNIQKRFGETVILKSFDYTFKRGERIGIVGPNGVGKTTFLNIITGQESPDFGKINLGESVVFGYYTQENTLKMSDRRVIEAVKDVADIIPTSDGSHITAAQMLTRFQFPYEAQYKYIRHLSGGERRRLQLLLVLMKNPNFLVLDEPTNDLDLLTMNALEEFLVHFKGCLVVVSHDRFFMDKLVDHLLVMDGQGEVIDHNGSYREYRETKKLEEKAQKVKTEAPKVEIPSAKPSGKSKLSFNEKRELEQLEKEISSLEEEKIAIENYLSSGDGSPTEIAEKASRYERVQAELDEKSMRWLELEEKK